jgi:ATP-dependent DNA helicase DinG
VSSPDVTEVEAALRRAAGALPGGGESRTGQVEMAAAVARAIESGRSLVVQAGTGTGKSLAYLVPAVLAGVPVVVATATKALQDQLATKDLPLLADTVEGGFSFAVLKGRSNYLCLQRVAEMGGAGQVLELLPASADPPDADDPLRPRSEEDPGTGTIAEQVTRLVRWSRSTATGDRAELDFEPHFRAWAAVSTTARECPGPFRCPSGHECFAEEARARAAAADVVVVNTHLYGAHLASGGAVLPPHAVVVLDEAHAVEEVMTDSLGVEIGPGRFRALAAAARPLLHGAGPGTSDAADPVAELATLFAHALEPFAGRRVPAGAITGGAPDGEPAGHEGPSLAEVVTLALGRLTTLSEALRAAERADDEAQGTRHDRVLLAAGHLAADLTRLIELGDDEVAWVEAGAGSPSLRVSPIDVGPILSERLWESVTGVLTSATLPVGIAARLGLPESETDLLDVGSPFDYKRHALLYVAQSLPDRRRPESEPALHAELELLIEAAGGRTLALFTSWRAMRAAAEAVASRLPFPILTQSDLPKPALIEAFREQEEACLFATLGFFQGVDLPGRTLSLVTIDRIPFPRPDDPVLEARRERAGWEAFSLVDLPRAGTLLAQGAGRLIRSAADRGVVAVLDSRLATARYRATLLARVPPMRRTVDRDEVTAFLRAIAAEG